MNWVVVTVWSKLFRSDIIESQKIRFPKGMSLGEDLLFSLSYIASTDSVRTVDASCYCYSNIKQTGKSLSMRALPIQEFMEYTEFIASVLKHLEQKGVISSKEKNTF